MKVVVGQVQHPESRHMEGTTLRKQPLYERTALQSLLAAKSERGLRCHRF